MWNKTKVSWQHTRTPASQTHQMKLTTTPINTVVESAQREAPAAHVLAALPAQQLIRVGKLADLRDDPCDALTKLLCDSLQADMRVVHNIMQQRGRDCRLHPAQYEANQIIVSKLN